MNALVPRRRSLSALRDICATSLVRRSARASASWNLGSTVSELVESLSSLVELSALQEGSRRWSHLASFR